LILAGAADQEPFTYQDLNKYEDGYLTAFEVVQMNLEETQLVVLSACETGLGEVQSGEGVWGLQRAFQMAGARAVLGSLWKIDDEATVTFMDAFYENYLEGHGLNASYMSAVARTRKIYPHPYYWGAFTLIGRD
jgi:CHAT domain-containing protein